MDQWKKTAPPETETGRTRQIQTETCGYRPAALRRLTARQTHRQAVAL